jgi:hypothetical protein
VRSSSEIRTRHDRPSANAISKLLDLPSDIHLPTIILSKELIAWWEPHTSRSEDNTYVNTQTHLAKTTKPDRASKSSITVNKTLLQFQFLVFHREESVLLFFISWVGW